MAAKKETTRKKPPMDVVESVEGFTEWIKDLEGGLFLYRGLADHKWEVETSARRRLRESRDETSTDVTPREFQSYIIDLLQRARRRGFGLRDGVEIPDLYLLAELQHYGAATCLIDFTVNPLIALWFACGEKNKSGKVVAIKTDDPDEFSEPSYEDTNNKKIQDFLNEKKLCKWEPSDRNNRIIAQQSIFVFGRKRIEKSNYKEIQISREYKAAILEDLKQFGITEDTLFRDFPGFSFSNFHNKPYAVKSAKDYFDSGRAAQQRGEYKKAVEDYDEAIVLNPKYAIARYNRGNTHLVLNNYQDAIEDYAAALELNPKYAEAYNNRGVAKNNLKDHQSAIEDYSKAMEFNPQHANTYNNRGNAKNSLGDYQGAIEDCVKAIELDPQCASAYNNRGNAKYFLEDYQGAIEDCTKAIELDPQHAHAYNNRGNAKHILEDYQGALEDYNKAIACDPQYAHARNNRGHLKNFLEDYRGAIEDYDKAIALDPQYAEAYSNRGNVKNSLGNYPGAIEDHTKAIEINPEFAEAYHNRGIAKQASGDEKGANEDFQKAKELERKK